MNGQSVLMVEDEPPTRLLRIDVLNEAGFKAIAVANGDEALDISRADCHKCDHQRHPDARACRRARTEA